MPALDYVELVFSKLLKGVRGHEAGIFAKGPSFSAFPEPNIKVTSPDCGPTGSSLPLDYTQEGKNEIPGLAWETNPSGVEIKEWVLICEDVDAYVISNITFLKRVPRGAPSRGGGVSHVPQLFFIF